MKIAGLHTYRFEENPEERRFAKAWEDQNRHGSNLAYLLHMGEGRGRPPEPNEREHVVAATVIQWLGSPVGQCFLRDLGYVRTDEKRTDEKRAAEDRRQR